MQAIKTALDQVTLLAPTTYHGLSVFPLLADLPGSKSYLTLDEAQARNGLTISEVSESGTVPELRLDNRLEMPVLLLDGEELVGAKQNRVLNLTVLAPAKSTITIPVSCVEQGRWSYRDPEFKSANRAQFAEGRARKMESVSRFMDDIGEARSDQGEVWESVREKAMMLRVKSRTDAMSDIFDQHKESVEGYVENFHPRPDQTGALFAVNGRVTGFDLFDNSQTLAELFPKLVRSYALDVIEQDSRRSALPDGLIAEGLIRSVGNTKPERFKACGEGEDVRLSSETVVAGALVVDDAVIHLAAFLKRDESRPGHRGPRGSYARASARRRMRGE